MRNRALKEEKKCWGVRMRDIKVKKIMIRRSSCARGIMGKGWLYRKLDAWRRASPHGAGTQTPELGVRPATAARCL